MFAGSAGNCGSGAGIAVAKPTAVATTAREVVNFIVKALEGNLISCWEVESNLLMIGDSANCSSL